uniref:Uncharacterized protein n=1 Tax=Nelumbo nucifera TaxID=4432 RepID=A0A822ZFY8_NELNU|nr:TPA_asm: hypothetical protein HUJ06_000555 [Nelumbo nucifera]
MMVSLSAPLVNCYSSEDGSASLSCFRNKNGDALVWLNIIMYNIFIHSFNQPLL